MTGPADILVQICARRRQRLGVAAGEFALPPAGTCAEGRTAVGADNAFVAALAARRGGAVIAEVKLGSPKLGSLVGSFDPEEQARTYAGAGAAALSVVVEPDFFWGDYDVLRRCREVSGLPAVAKDFVVSYEQLEAARRAGASAVLLVASLYDAETLGRFAAAARSLGLVPLVETHDLADLRKLADRDWELVGVNNRDLRTFEVDLDHSISLVPALPPGALRVAESGIRCRGDVVTLQRAGFDAFLIGESLVKSQDPAAKLAELLGAAA